MTVVLDASALIALLLIEPGHDRVRTILEIAAISSVNWSEVVQQLLKRNKDVHRCRQDLMSLGLSIVPFDTLAAEQAASLWLQGRDYRLSLGDRACIALGLSLHTTILTADRVWLQAFPNLPIQLIR